VRSPIGINAPFRCPPGGAPGRNLTCDTRFRNSIEPTLSTCGNKRNWPCEQAISSLESNAASRTREPGGIHWAARGIRESVCSFAAWRVAVGSGGRVVQKGSHLRLRGMRVEVPALDVSRAGAAHELSLWNEAFQLVARRDRDHSSRVPWNTRMGIENMLGCSR
jgi:hypothetical protein